MTDYFEPCYDERFKPVPEESYNKWTGSRWLVNDMGFSGSFTSDLFRMDVYLYRKDRFVPDAVVQACCLYVKWENNLWSSAVVPVLRKGLSLKGWKQTRPPKNQTAREAYNAALPHVLETRGKTRDYLNTKEETHEQGETG